MFNSTDKYKYQYKYNALEKLISSTDFYFTPFLISHKETPKVGISNEKCDDILKNQNINQIHLCFYEIYLSLSKISAKIIINYYNNYKIS